MAASTNAVGIEDNMEEEERRERGEATESEISVELLQEELTTLAKKWYEFGQKIDLRSTQLHLIESETGRDAEYYFKEMLVSLLDEESGVKVSWDVIVGVVRDLGEETLSDQLAKKYGIATQDDGEKEGEGEGSVPDLNTQKDEIHALLNQKLKKGDTWYLVDVKWMKLWKKYVGYDQWDQSSSGQQTYFPGPIDTSNLFSDGGEAGVLKEHLMEELDYSLVPEPAWNKLVAWYGVSNTSRPIARTVVEYGLYMKHSKVEVYLLNFKLCIHPKLNEHVIKSFSRADTISDLERELRHTFSIDQTAVCRVWHRYMSHTYELLNDSTQTLQDAGLYNMQTIVLECRKEDGTWPRSTRETSFAAAHSTRSQDSITGATTSSSHTSSGHRSGGGTFWNSSYSQEPSHPGLCGLSNLGNTCFMNSALQCLSNTQPLTEYFNMGAYKKHINKNNPLGMHGQVAETYGSLLDDMWGGKCSACSPRQFKTVVGKFAPQFSGYQQQDSHELLAFLLDGLHEDLNLVLKKPFVDMSINTEGREEKDIAEESWYKYLQRNQSVVVSVFQGQLKSTLVCPDCNKVSKIFDPFMYLSLPLPVKKTRKMELHVIYADPLKPIVKYSLVVPKRGTVGHLKKELSEQTMIKEDMMVVVDIYNSRFHRIYDNKENLSHILDRDDIFVYELLHSIGDTDWVHVPIYHREEIVKNVNYGYSSSSYTQRYHNLFGLPTIVRVPRSSSTYHTVYQAVLSRCSRYVCSPEEAKRRMAVVEKERQKEGEREGEEGEGGGEPMDEGNSNQNGENNEQAQQETTEVTDNNDDKPVNQVSNNNETSTSDRDQDNNGEGGGEGEGEGEGGGGGGGEKPVVFEMFKLMIVNSYGTQNIRELTNDDSTLRLTSQTYVACDWSTDMKDKCYDIDAALEKEDHSTSTVPEGPPKEITLYDCLTLFTVKEQLSKDDEWFCPECKDLVQATKKFDLWKLPRVLVIHLKRFSYNRYWRDKLDTYIDFPISELDLKDYVQAPDQPEPVYDLFAVSNHFGGMGGGHYTAYCKNKATGKWYNFDDSHVSETTEDRIVSSSAYLLFYCRRDEGKVVHPPLNRTLSQTFADEVQKRKKKYNPSETSHDEETMEQEEAGPDNNEPHPPSNNNNNTSYDDETFNSPSSMNEPD